MATMTEKPKKTKPVADENPAAGAPFIELAQERTKVYGARGSLVVPFVVSGKYAQTEIHMSLKRDQAATLRGVLEGLEDRHAKLNSGAPVANPQDAIRWMLEELARSNSK